MVFLTTAHTILIIIIIIIKYKNKRQITIDFTNLSKQLCVVESAHNSSNYYLHLRTTKKVHVSMLRGSEVNRTVLRGASNYLLLLDIWVGELLRAHGVEHKI